MMLNEEQQKMRFGLIDHAQKYPSQPLYYAEVASWFDLSMGDPGDRTVLSELLGDVAQYEKERGRPFLSAVVTYSPSTMATKKYEKGDDMTHGPGLVNRAKAMGLDKSPKFDPLTFGDGEEKAAYHYWQNPRNYRAFRNSDHE